MMYGVDIGGTKTEFAAFDEDLTPRCVRRIATPTRDYDRLVRIIAEWVQAADAQFERAGLIGVGLPGVRDRHGHSFSVNVPCIAGRNVGEDLGSALDRNVALINDGRAFALSEAHGGAGQGHDPMVGVILGTGAFGGYCIGGELQGGRDGLAGEWGHLPIAATTRDRHSLPLQPCGCGRQGCIETYISGPGLSLLHAHVAGSSISPERLVQRMRAGEAASRRAFNIWIDCVASCFAQFILHINPEIIVVGGGLSRIRELYAEIQPALAEHLFSGLPPPRVVPARFGDRSGSRGAAIFAALHRDRYSEREP